MQINCFIWIADKPMGDDESALGAIMELNKIIWILDTPTEGRSIGGLRYIGPSTVTLSLSLSLGVNSAKGLSGLPTSYPGQGQHIVPRHGCLRPTPETEKRMAVGYDVLTLSG
jgi:hypothetical protein